MKIDVDDIRGRLQTFGAFTMDGDEAIAHLALIDAAVAFNSVGATSVAVDRINALVAATLPFMPEKPK